MLTLIDWILDLFRNEDAARAFVSAPEQTMRDAGLAGVSAAQVSAVAATAVPGLALGGDPIVGLQRAVSNQYGFAPAYQQRGSASGQCGRLGQQRCQRTRGTCWRAVGDRTAGL